MTNPPPSRIGLELQPGPLARSLIYAPDALAADLFYWLSGSPLLASQVIDALQTLAGLVATAYPAVPDPLT
jgi:hypothetical protein